MTAVAPAEVVGRHPELERIGGFLDPGRGELALLLEGVAGIGKTTLWCAGIELARRQQFRVLWCRPTASETAFSFAALGDLLAPVVGEVLARLPPPQRAAIGAALALVETDVPEVDERVVGLALLSSLRLLADRDPVLVAVDDVQWLDPASAAVLWFAARRLQDERLKLLLSVRVEPGAAPPQIERELAERVLRTRVGPLSSSDLHRIVVARFGRPLPRPTLVGVHHAAGGNPFYALELTRFLLEEAKPPGPGDPLPVPPTLEELLRARITRLPKATRDALEVAALLSEPTLAALGALEGAGAGPGWLDRAVAGGVVELVDDRVRFTHPLLAAAVSSTMGPGRRRGRGTWPWPPPGPMARWRRRWRRPLSTRCCAAPRPRRPSWRSWPPSGRHRTTRNGAGGGRSRRGCGMQPPGTLRARGRCWSHCWGSCPPVRCAERCC
jgi:hypothetical protein